MPLHGFVKRNLAKCRADVGVRRQGHVEIGIEKDTDRQLSRHENDLSCGLVLAVKDPKMDGPGVTLKFRPCESYVKLWSLAMELFNETVQAAADCSRIDAIIVKEILDRHFDEK